MDHYLYNMIKKTTVFIEDHLYEPITLDDISDHVNMSKFHLLRLWKGITGSGLIEYVRKRRIALSLADLFQNRNSIDYIAGQYGFGCARTYNRVFIEEFGISPAKWRRNPYPLEITDQLNLEFLACAGDGLIYLRAITVLPAFSIAGIELRIDIQENRLTQVANRVGVDFVNNHMQRVQNGLQPNVYIGYTTIPKDEDHFTYYQPSIQINHDSIVPLDMKIIHISPHKYGVFTYVGAHRPEEISSVTLSDIWNHVYHLWMPTVTFDLKTNFRFERIDRSRCKDDYCECDLYYPITRL